MEKNRELFFPNTTQEEINEYCDEHYHDWITHLKVLPGAVETLNATSALYPHRIAIVTNCPIKITTVILDGCNFNHYFQSRVICAGTTVTYNTANSTTFIKAKPEPDGINYALHMLGVKPEEALFVG